LCRDGSCKQKRRERFPSRFRCERASFAGEPRERASGAFRADI
jgi:hypothetical protein